MNKPSTCLLLILIIPAVLLLISCDPPEEIIDTTVVCDDASICWDDDYSISSHNNSLNDLYEYITVSGTLSIKDSEPSMFSQTSLSGLEYLSAIGGDLIIDGIDSLVSAEGLDNLLTINGNLEIRDNISLPDLAGLDGLTAVGGNVIIHNNDSLKNLDGLNNLTFIGGDLVITENAMLTSLKGLYHVDYIGGDLIIIISDHYAEFIDVAIFGEGSWNNWDSGDEERFQEYLKASKGIVLYTDDHGINTLDNDSLPLYNVLKLISVIGRTHIKGSVKLFHVDLEKGYN